MVASVGEKKKYLYKCKCILWNQNLPASASHIGVVCCMCVKTNFTLHEGGDGILQHHFSHSNVKCIFGAGLHCYTEFHMISLNTSVYDCHSVNERVR